MTSRAGAGVGEAVGAGVGIGLGVAVGRDVGLGVALGVSLGDVLRGVGAADDPVAVSASLAEGRRLIAAGDHAGVFVVAVATNSVPVAVG